MRAHFHFAFPAVTQINVTALWGIQVLQSINQFRPLTNEDGIAII